MRLPTIVIDPGGLDALTFGQGQFRYMVDLLHGLSSLDPPARFIVLGGRPEPAPELAGLFTRPSWRYVSFVRSTGRGAMYREQVRLAATLLSLRADLYHGLDTIVPVFALCPIVATILDLIFELFTEYASAARSRPYRLYRWAVRNRVRRAVCISQTTANDAARLWRIRPGRLDVIHLGTTFLGSAATTVVPGLAAEDKIILSTYNLEPRKNLTSLLRAYALCRPAGTRLVLYGRSAVTSEREREFDALVSELGIGAAVIRTGYVSDAQLSWLYRRAEVFVFPSLYEGFGYPVLEAMAAGACVVARAASAMAEVVGTAGVLVETANQQQVAAALTRLLADAGEREWLRIQAVVRAELFTLRRMAEQTWRTYEAALGSALI